MSDFAHRFTAGGKSKTKKKKDIVRARKGKDMDKNRNKNKGADKTSRATSGENEHTFRVIDLHILPRAFSDVDIPWRDELDESDDWMYEELPYPPGVNKVHVRAIREQMLTPSTLNGTVRLLDYVMLPTKIVQQFIATGLPPTKSDNGAAKSPPDMWGYLLTDMNQQILSSGDSGHDIDNYIIPLHMRPEYIQGNAYDIRHKSRLGANEDELIDSIMRHSPSHRDAIEWIDYLKSTKSIENVPSMCVSLTRAIRQNDQHFLGKFGEQIVNEGCLDEQSEYFFGILREALASADYPTLLELRRLGLSMISQPTMEFIEHTGVFMVIQNQNVDALQFILDGVYLTGDTFCALFEGIAEMSNREMMDVLLNPDNDAVPIDAASYASDDAMQAVYDASFARHGNLAEVKPWLRHERNPLTVRAMEFALSHRTTFPPDFLWHTGEWTDGAVQNIRYALNHPQYEYDPDQSNLAEVIDELRTQIGIYRHEQEFDRRSTIQANFGLNEIQELENEFSHLL